MAENGRGRKQEERRADSEREIIRAARDLFALQGFTHTTLNQVGAAAGYTGGLVSHRFGSKEGLLKAVLHHISSRFLEDQLKPSIAIDSAQDAIKNCIEIYLTEISTRESHMRALYVIMGEALGSVPEIGQEVATLNRKTREELAAVIRLGIKTGKFRPDLDVQAASVVILGLLRGITMQALADSKALKIKELIPEVQCQVLAGLRS